MKRLLYKLIFPPFAVVLIFTLLTALGMAIAISSGMASNILNYVIYAISAYGITALTAFLIKNGKKGFESVKRRIYKTKYGNKFFTDVDFKTRVTLYFSFIVNFGNVILNITYGFVFHTNWFYALAFYYVTLTVLRFILALYTRKHILGENLLLEWKRARICAAVLTLINISLTGIVLMMIYMHKGFNYEGILIYVIAMYSFYHVTTAIIDLVKYRKYKSPVISSVKMVKLAAALVSMLTLETAMLSSFGADMPDTDKKIFIAATGAGICIVVLGLSSYMIVESTHQINKLRNSKND